MNEPALHSDVRNQNGVQSESDIRSKSAALQKQTAEFYKQKSHYFTDTELIPISSYTFLRLKFSVSSFVHFQVIYRRCHKEP